MSRLSSRARSIASRKERYSFPSRTSEFSLTELAIFGGGTDRPLYASIGLCEGFCNWSNGIAMGAVLVGAAVDSTCACALCSGGGAFCANSAPGPCKARVAQQKRAMTFTDTSSARLRGACASGRLTI